MFYPPSTQNRSAKDKNLNLCCSHLFDQFGDFTKGLTGRAYIIKNKHPLFTQVPQSVKRVGQIHRPLLTRKSRLMRCGVKLFDTLSLYWKLPLFFQKILCLIKTTTKKPSPVNRHGNNKVQLFHHVPVLKKPGLDILLKNPPSNQVPRIFQTGNPLTNRVGIMKYGMKPINIGGPSFVAERSDMVNTTKTTTGVPNLLQLLKAALAKTGNFGLVLGGYIVVTIITPPWKGE